MPSIYATYKYSSVYAADTTVSLDAIRIKESLSSPNREISRLDRCILVIVIAQRMFHGT